MARFVMELPILGVQVTKVEEKVYAKVFVGEEPDGVSEQIVSVMSMPILAEYAQEVFAAASTLKLGQMVKLTIETARGGKQSVKNEVVHIEPVQRSQSSQPNPSARPTEQPKA